jgi:hypothetical protein
MDLGPFNHLGMREKKMKRQSFLRAFQINGAQKSQIERGVVFWDAKLRISFEYAELSIPLILFCHSTSKFNFAITSLSLAIDN